MPILPQAPITPPGILNSILRNIPISSAGTGLPLPFLTERKSKEELDKLADDIQLYFGLGCRNVTQLYVPPAYDFVPLLEALRKYAFFMDQHKYLHNFDYNLTIQIMNNRFYMSNDSVLLTENASPFSPIGQIHYQFYEDKDKVTEMLDPEKVQCIVGKGFTAFGKAQSPGLTDYADGVDPMKFLCAL